LALFAWLDTDDGLSDDELAAQAITLMENINARQTFISIKEFRYRNDCNLILIRGSIKLTTFFHLKIASVILVSAIFHGALIKERRLEMIKVKTFASPLKIFQARKELEELDAMVNKFIEENDVQKVISVSDACTTDDTGASIGLVRVLAYEWG
jgi:hypothetical protein